jgi:hypothetical protein
MTVTSTTQTGYTPATNKTTATKATSAYENTAPVQTQQTDKMAEMQEKYKDVYTPIPETYSKADEDLQTQKIHEAYPNYMTGPEFLKIVDKYYQDLGGEPFKLGTTPTQEQIQKGKEASAKALQEIGHTEKSFSQMQKDVQVIQAQYPVNTLAKEGVSNAKEIARFTNAAVYEGLESGKTVGEAKKDAINMRSSFLDMDFMRDQFLKSIGASGGKYDPVPINYTPENPLWDLRANGINGRWEDNSVYENDNAMISELNKKISQFNFMLNNKDVIETANNNLDPSNRGMINTYESQILDDKLPKVQMALDIFKNYKIYDSIDVKA